MSPPPIGEGLLGKLEASLVQKGCSTVSVKKEEELVGVSPLVAVLYVLQTLNAVTTVPPIFIRFFSYPSLFRIMPIRVLDSLLYLVSAIRYWMIWVILSHSKVYPSGDSFEAMSSSSAVDCL